MQVRTKILLGYYQPAGPLINVPQHGHSTSTSLGKSAPLSEVSSSPTPPPSHQTHSQSSTTDSLDSDVIITSATSSKEAIPHQPPPPPPTTYRYSQYPAPHPGYAYGYPPQYYPSPHHPPSYHHDLCYPNPYLHHKPYPPPTYRRHLTAPAGTQYYQANPPDIYHPPPAVSSQQNQQVVTANPSSSSTYQSSSGGPPPPLMESYPPPTLVEPYPPPPHYYPGYGPTPSPACFTHSPPTRTLPYLSAAYQTCPCPMQSCPKNVHTGPLIGDSKRSGHISSIAKNSLPLPPVALALPLEPVSATGPPSPARGSAGMPPPPSPAGATYQPPPPAPKQEVESLDCKPNEKKRKARVGKNMVRNNIAAHFPENTMLLMCHQPLQQRICVTDVKRELESPEETKICPILKSVVERPEIVLCADVVEEIPKKKESNVFQLLKVEKHIEPSLTVGVEADEKFDKLTEEEEEHLPCQKTVAENVKVKNMKRKLSVTKDLEKVDTDTISSKKARIEKLKVNGSYKDLIKKHVPSIKIDNGKRKLNVEGVRRIVTKNSRLQLKKLSAKRKLSPCTEKSSSKRVKLSKPLIASNLHNSKQNLKLSKGKCFNEIEFSENKEPSQKTTKKLQVNSKNSINDKKLAPAILDNLFSKNNVDRTIECVINRYSESSRNTHAKTEVFKLQEKGKKLRVNVVSIRSTNCTNKSKTIIAKKIGASKRKSKRRSIEVPIQVIQKLPKKLLVLPKWSNGWAWKGDPYQAKVFLNSDETVVVRKCYPAMEHSEGDTIEPRDCVLLKAGPRKNDLPFVAKIAALWENPEDGEMMMSLLWYYRPEHTEQGRQEYDEPDEVFASRHKDTNSVACIEDKCYVLTFNEYCSLSESDNESLVSEISDIKNESSNNDITDSLCDGKIFTAKDNTEWHSNRLPSGCVQSPNIIKATTNKVVLTTEITLEESLDTFNWYRKSLKRIEEGLEDTSTCIPKPELYPRVHRQPPSTFQTPPDLIFFCRRVYDFRQKRIVKNPS
ncbi:hypothetical protein FQA39_LY10291 [Lamprigera yunnana]|nr:hypothetical protein FQA39_LY10291 [Lamprigera yunnana]